MVKILRIITFFLCAAAAQLSAQSWELTLLESPNSEVHDGIPLSDGSGYILVGTNDHPTNNTHDFMAFVKKISP